MSQCTEELGLLENPQRSLEYLEQMEQMGEEIICDRQEIVDLDRRRNQTREALRALHGIPAESKTWLTLGSLLIKMPTDKAQNLLQRDQQQLDTQINMLRSDLKVKVNKLREMEYQPPVPGIMLTPLSRSEMDAVGQVLGRHT
ncbi:p53 and DNA damage-regulated protein 1-like isoform X2 [Periplaneta americana]|uniref:p53 and DNA damage-regulated protein 1-like isoform X2 n=1 Tax=Periplaneta americana TaxID=6978 RepID=UPI0037E9A65D